MPEQAYRRWDFEGIRQALAASAQAIEHKEHGVGVHFTIGDTGTAVLLYPHATPSPRLEVRTKNVAAIFVNANPPAIGEHRVFFLGGGREEEVDNIGIDADGSITLVAFPYSVVSPQPSSHGEVALPAPPPVPPPPPSALQEARPAGLPEHPSDAAEAEAPAGGREKLEKIEVWGNVGYEPKYTEFRSGGARLQFALSQHRDDGTTQWHVVKAFGERAKRYNSTFGKGDAVQVVGGKATETYKDKQGKEQTRQFIMLWGMKRLGGK